MDGKEIIETKNKIKIDLLNSDGTLNIENLILHIALLQVAIKELKKES